VALHQPLRLRLLLDCHVRVESCLGCWHSLLVLLF
jgi:hypothetical protein